MLKSTELVNKSEYEKDENGLIDKDITNLNQIVDTYNIKYNTYTNPEDIDGYICMPKLRKGKLPVLIYIRGGLSTYGKWGDKEAATFLSWLSSLGFIVIMSNLRLKDEGGGAEIEDIYYLETILNNLPEADVSKINIIGHSMGAINTYNILKESKFKSELGKIIVIAGCSDTNYMMEKRPNLRDHWNKFFDTESTNENYKRSVVKWVDKFPTNLHNLYILHGTLDSRVDYTNFENLKTEMKKNFKQTNFISVPNADHNPNYYREQIKNILLESN